jgi:phosphatidylserine/phosphatidylglycerophosphate/cardiolipin synthase-like enzyme
MKRGGCRISIVANTVEPRALAALRAAGIAPRRMPIHDKSFVVFGKFAAGFQFRVYTGSHNLSSGAAHRFDEIFVKLAPETGTVHPIYDAYLRHFNDAFSVGAAF